MSTSAEHQAAVEPPGTSSAGAARGAVTPPFPVLLAYTVGAIGFNVLERLLNMWLAFYYLDESSPGHVSISASAFFGIMWVGRAVDAVADPTAAYLSDRTRTRLGRRRTFLVAGIVPMCVFGALIFFPPSSGLVLTSSLLALWLSLFWIGFTV